MKQSLSDGLVRYLVFLGKRNECETFIVQRSVHRLVLWQKNGKAHTFEVYDSVSWYDYREVMAEGILQSLHVDFKRKS